MKVFGRIDGSLSGAVLTRPCANSSSGASTRFAAQVQYGRSNGLRLGGQSHRLHQIAPTRPKETYRSSVAPNTRPFGAAANANDRVVQHPPAQGYFFSHPTYNRSWSHSIAAPEVVVEPNARPLPPRPPSKEELLGFIDDYDDTTVEEHLKYARDPYRRGYAPPNGLDLGVSNQREDYDAPLPHEILQGDPEDIETVRKLEEAITLRLRKPTEIDLETVYDLYLALPEQRMLYLTGNLRHRLFAVMGMTERKDPKSMLRYFSIFADTKNCGFQLTTSEWNTGISFASRYVGNSTEVETEAALKLWRQMELTAGIKASAVTFNILFDVASKSGNFTLAEMIYDEMNARGFPFNRYHYVSLIHFFGLKLDSSGVRATYKEMVHAGEIIDTVVLNAVLSGLFQSGEESSAEQLYEHMKHSANKSGLMPNRDYKTQKMITKTLMMFAKVGKKHPDLYGGFQGVASLAPDLQTYRILLRHYGVKLGDMNHVVRYLDEMKLFRVPLHGAIFHALFKSFSLHGARGSDWSEQRLENVWTAFLEAFDSGTATLTIQPHLVRCILSAYAKCSTQRRLLEVYEDLDSRWDLDVSQAQSALSFLHRLMKSSEARF